MSHEVNSYYGVYGERIVKARKEHVCDACDEPILIGDAYWRIFLVGDEALHTMPGDPRPSSGARSQHLAVRTARLRRGLQGHLGEGSSPVHRWPRVHDAGTTTTRSERDMAKGTRAKKKDASTTKTSARSKRGVEAGRRSYLKALTKGAPKSVSPPPVSEGIEPIDLERCQAERPNGYNFMTLGGVPGRARCENKPKVVIQETKPGFDGKIGHMALCHGCLEVFKQTRSTWRDDYKITDISLVKAQMKWDGLDEDTKTIFMAHGLCRPE